MNTKRQHFAAFIEWLEARDIEVDTYWLERYDLALPDESLQEKVPSVHDFALALSSQGGYDHFSDLYKDAQDLHIEALKWAAQGAKGNETKQDKQS